MLDHTTSDSLNAAYAAITRMDAGEIDQDEAERVIREQNLPHAFESLIVGALRMVVDCRENLAGSDRKSVDGGSAAK